MPSIPSSIASIPKFSSWLFRHNPVMLSSLLYPISTDIWRVGLLTDLGSKVAGMARHGLCAVVPGDVGRRPSPQHQTLQQYYGTLHHVVFHPWQIQWQWPHYDKYISMSDESGFTLTSIFYVKLIPWMCLRILDTTYNIKYK